MDGPAAVEGDPDSALAVSLDAARRIDDVFAQVLLYVRIADAYSDVGLIFQATSVLERAIRIAETERVGAARGEIFAQLSFPFIELDRIERARTLLFRALDESEQIDDVAISGIVLQEVINAAFVGGEELFDVLRRAVDQVYVVMDLPTRVALLTDIARQYQESGLGQQVNTLVQQAISAAAGIDNPWQKAASYAGIARRFSVAGNDAQADLYVRRSLLEVEGVRVPARTQGDAARLLTVSEHLSAIGKYGEAERVIDTIEFANIRTRGLSELGSRFLESGRHAEAERLFDSAVNLSATEGSDAQLADAISDVAVRLLDGNRQDLAESNAEVALLVVTDVQDDFTRTEVLQRLGRLFVRIDRLDLALESAGQLPDPTQRTRLYTAIAGALLDRQEIEAALRVAGQAQDSAERADYQTDEIHVDLVELLSRLGSYSRAISLVDRIESRAAQGRALVHVGRYSLRVGGLSTAERGELVRLGGRIGL